MDARKTLAKYLRPSPAVLVIGCILLAVMLISLIFGIISNAKGANAAEPFHPLTSKMGGDAYLDVVGVSEWVYNYNGNIYYATVDAGEYLYIVQLSAKEYQAMGAQQDYWNSVGEAASAEPYRITGLVRGMLSDVRSGVCEVFGVADSEYEDYFGTLYLDATSSAASERGAIAFIIALFSGLLGLILIIVRFAPNRNFKKFLNRLEELGELECAAEELSAPDNIIVGRDRARLSQHFLFGRGSGAVVRYDDIEWAFKRISRYNFIAVDASLVINTKTMNNVSAISFGGNDKNSELEAVLGEIASRNPQALVGFTRENIQANKARKAAAKNSAR